MIFERSTTTVVMFTPASIACISLLILTGACMQSYANEAIGAFLVLSLFLFSGCAGVMLVFRCKKPELRAFMLTFAICIFVGGLAQNYSLIVFKDIQSTVDAHTFFGNISPRPPYRTMADIHKISNSPLAIVIWQQVYKMAWFLGIDFGPYIAVMFNALVMGVTSSVTVRTARELFDDDLWRLRRVGTCFAFCGLFILFGSIFLRDCFTTFINAVVIWWLVRWICTPTIRNLFTAIAVTGISVYAMAYLRFEGIVLFGVYWFLTLFFWFWKDRLNMGRLMAIYITLPALFFGSSYLMNYVHFSTNLQFDRAERYAGKSIISSQDDSLAMRLVVRQSMPIRLVMGSGSLMIFPIPLWGYFKLGINDYHLIKGYHGIYQFFVLPLVLSGFFLSFKQFVIDHGQSMPFLFLAAYLLVNLWAVVATSLEQRHLAQFMTVFCIMAAVPDTRVFMERVIAKRFMFIWFSVVLLVHVAWLVAGGIRN